MFYDQPYFRQIDPLPASLDAELDSEVVDILEKAGVMAAHVAALSLGSHDQLIVPLGQGTDVDPAIREIGLAGVVGVAGPQSVGGVPSIPLQQVPLRPSFVAKPQVKPEVDRMRHFGILDREDDGEGLAGLRVCLVAREDHASFQHTSVGEGSKAGKRAHEGPDNTGGEMHGGGSSPVAVIASAPAAASGRYQAGIKCKFLMRSDSGSGGSGDSVCREERTE